MTGRHDPAGPSRLAAWSICPSYDGEQGTEAGERGHRVHALAESLIRSDGSAALEGAHDEVNAAWRCYQHSTLLAGTKITERWFDGAVPDTGGTVDFLCISEDGVATIIDWKASLPETRTQLVAYSLNVMIAMPEVKEVKAYFFNYTDGECSEVYEMERCEAIQLTHSMVYIAGIKEARQNRASEPRKASKQCAYCIHRATCKEAIVTTTTELSNPEPNLAAMPLPDLLDAHARLKVAMKRGEALESAMRDRLMAAARAGELPGYTVKVKRGNKLEWTDEVAAADLITSLMLDNFLQVNPYKISGLRSPTVVKAELKAALGVSFTPAVEQALNAWIKQNTYETLCKEKDHG